MFELDTTAFQRDELPARCSERYLKGNVYENNPHKIESLQENTKRDIRKIPNDAFEKLMDNFNVRLVIVIPEPSTWIQHMINY